MNAKASISGLLALMMAVALGCGANTSGASTGPTTNSGVPPVDTSRPDPAAIVVGDSLVFGAGWFIDHDLTAAGAPPPTQTAVIGYTTIQLADSADQAVASSPSRGPFVFAAGTNDVGHAATDGPPIDAGLSQLDAVLGRAQAHGKCVITVGVTSHGSFQRFVLADEWNRRSAELVARHGGQFVNWDQLSLPHPEWFTEDGIHHTPAGQQAYAEFIVAAVRSCR